MKDGVWSYEKQFHLPEVNIALDTHTFNFIAFVIGFTWFSGEIKPLQATKSKTEYFPQMTMLTDGELCYDIETHLREGNMLEDIYPCM
jgi:hypothetical protein